VRRETVDGLHLGFGGGGEGPLIVFVHGGMDRGAAFLRVTRSLDDHRWCVYDRRGYGRSSVDRPLVFNDHVDDLVSLLDRFADRGPVVLVGHSLGATIALSAAARRADAVASLLTYEAPLLWMSWWPSRDPEGQRLEEQSPEIAAMRFMARVVGPDVWDSLPAATRAHKIRDGASLIAELTSLRLGAPFDRADITSPCFVSRGSTADDTRQRAAQWLLDGLVDAQAREIEDAPHIAHATHPEQFAALVVEAAGVPVERSR
jgi:pimeloyl-ACP methyl ester carboxylesterase